MDLTNWNNFSEPLSLEDLDAIRSKVSGFHFMKEMLTEHELQLLYCAEALLREVDRDLSHT